MYLLQEKTGNVFSAIKDPKSISIAIMMPCSNRISSQIALSFFIVHWNNVINYKLLMLNNDFFDFYEKIFSIRHSLQTGSKVRRFR